MADITKLKERIIREANEAAERIRAEAREEAARILDDARVRADAEAAEIRKTASAEAEQLEKRMLSAAGLDMRKLILKTRQDAIDAVFEKAFEKLMALPAGEYFGILSKMISAEIRTGKEILILSPEDFDRMPADFKTGAAEVIRGDAKMGAGFILRDGDVEINGTFEALFRMRRESIEGEVAGMLFGGIDGKDEG